MASCRIAVLVLLSSLVTARTAVSTNAGEGCKSSDVTKKLTTCLQGFTAALQGGDVCGSWNTFECCMTKDFASCDDTVKKSVADKVATQKSTFGMINPNLKGCTANCAGGGSSTVAVTQPTKTEQTFDALIDLDDPTTFTVQKFIDAVKTAAGVTDVPTAVVKAFEIIVRYTVPHSATMAQLKTAVATSNKVQESQITVRESAGRRLANQEGCTSSDVTQKLASCLQGFTASLGGGNVCGAWSTFECCMTKHFASCDDAVKKSAADKVAMQKSTFGTINPNLKSCTAQCAGVGSSPTTSASGPKDMDVTITIDGSTDPVAAATKAKDVKASAGTDTVAALKTALGGDVTIKTQPKAKAKVETKVKAEASKSAQIKSAISSNTVGKAVGGTVSVPAAQLPQLPPPATGSASSIFGAGLALVMILVQAAM